MRRRAAALGSVLLLVAAVACASGEAGDREPSGATTLTVYAAASLTETFTELGGLFEADHEGVEVTFAFGGSSDLVAQLQQGAPGDVLATADAASMRQAVDDGLLGGNPVDFASNTLQIAVPPDNPAGVASLRDLAAPGVQVVVCAPQVPCGSATGKVEDAAGVDIDAVSEEQSVTDVLDKVRTGEADAGLVYVTDVRAAGGRVRGVSFPESSVGVNTYPIGFLEDAKHQDLAREFIELVTGDVGRRILAAAGFAGPQP